MYKVDYYTLAICDDNTVGNIRQYYDTWYVDRKLDCINETELRRVIDIIKGSNKYMSVITSITKIVGHGDH